MLLVGQCGALTSRTADGNGINTAVDLIVNDALKFRVIYTGSCHRGNNSDIRAGKNRLFH